MAESGLEAIREAAEESRPGALALVTECPTSFEGSLTVRPSKLAQAGLPVEIARAAGELSMTLLLLCEDIAGSRASGRSAYRREGAELAFMSRTRSYAAQARIEALLTGACPAIVALAAIFRAGAVERHPHHHRRRDRIAAARPGALDQARCGLGHEGQPAKREKVCVTFRLWSSPA